MSTYTSSSAIPNGGPLVPIAIIESHSDGSNSVVPYTSAVPLYGSGTANTIITGYWSISTVYTGTPPPAASPAPGSVETSTDTQSVQNPTGSDRQNTGSASSNLAALATDSTRRNPTASTVGPGTAGAAQSSATSTGQAVITSSHGFSGGALGGVAAGCIVGAALIAGLATWAIMRHRLKYYRNLAAGAGPTAATLHINPPEKGMTSAAAAVSNGADTTFLGGILPVNTDDKEVKQRVTGMFEAAAIHVDNFYDGTKIAVPAEVNGDLEQFDSPVLAKSVAEMLSQGMAPKVVITRALTETLTSSIDPQIAPSWSLLPAEFAALPRSLHGSGRDLSPAQNSPALFWWRQLSVHLGPSIPENKAYLEHRAHTIAELINNFQTAFRPWRKTKYTAKQETDALVGTFTSAADTGVWLFGQRSMFSFFWGRTAPPGEMELRPALIKTTDANGQPLAKPREVVSRQLERTGGAAI